MEAIGARIIPSALKFMVVLCGLLAFLLVFATIVIACGNCVSSSDIIVRRVEPSEATAEFGEVLTLLDPKYEFALISGSTVDCNSSTAFRGEVGPLQ